MSTATRTAINRQNAALSTGPVTEEGKTRSKFNAVRHGLTSKSVVLPNENEEEYNEIRDSFIARYAPANSLEESLAIIVAETFWRRQRFYRLENAFLTERMNAASDASASAGDRDLSLLALFTDPAEMNRARLLLRYVTAAERAHNKAISELEKAQKERRANEPSELPSELEDTWAGLSDDNDAPHEQHAHEANDTQTPAGFVSHSEERSAASATVSEPRA